tara:strand:+ start:645 stop:4349 length:3705 start_codon:yes stop_codon:yes gene_type:complete
MAVDPLNDIPDPELTDYEGNPVLAKDKEAAEPRSSFAEAQAAADASVQARDMRDASSKMEQGPNWGLMLGQALSAGIVGGFDVVNRTENLPGVLKQQQDALARYNAMLSRAKKYQLFLTENPDSAASIAKLGGVDALARMSDADAREAFAKIESAQTVKDQLDWMENSGHFSSSQIKAYRSATNPEELNWMVSMDMNQDRIKREEETHNLGKIKTAFSIQQQNFENLTKSPSMFMGSEELTQWYQDNWIAAAEMTRKTTGINILAPEVGDLDVGHMGVQDTMNLANNQRTTYQKAQDDTALAGLKPGVQTTTGQVWPSTTEEIRNALKTWNKTSAAYGKLLDEANASGSKYSIEKTILDNASQQLDALAAATGLEGEDLQAQEEYKKALEAAGLTKDELELLKTHGSNLYKQDGGEELIKKALPAFRNLADYKTFTGQQKIQFKAVRDLKTQFQTMATDLGVLGTGSETAKLVAEGKFTTDEMGNIIGYPAGWNEALIKDLTPLATVPANIEKFADFVTSPAYLSTGYFPDEVVNRLKAEGKNLIADPTTPGAIAVTTSWSEIQAQAYGSAGKDWKPQSDGATTLGDFADKQEDSFNVQALFSSNEEGLLLDIGKALMALDHTQVGNNPPGWTDVFTDASLIPAEFGLKTLEMIGLVGIDMDNNPESVIGAIGRLQDRFAPAIETFKKYKGSFDSIPIRGSGWVEALITNEWDKYLDADTLRVLMDPRTQQLITLDVDNLVYDSTTNTVSTGEIKNQSERFAWELQSRSAQFRQEGDAKQKFLMQQAEGALELLNVKEFSEGLDDSEIGLRTMLKERLVSWEATQEANLLINQTLQAAPMQMLLGQSGDTIMATDFSTGLYSSLTEGISDLQIHMAQQMGMTAEDIALLPRAPGQGGTNVIGTGISALGLGESALQGVTEHLQGARINKNGVLGAIEYVNIVQEEILASQIKNPAAREAYTRKQNGLLVNRENLIGETYRHMMDMELGDALRAYASFTGKNITQGTVDTIARNPLLVAFAKEQIAFDMAVRTGLGAHAVMEEPPHMKTLNGRLMQANDEDTNTIVQALAKNVVKGAGRAADRIGWGAQKIGLGVSGGIRDSAETLIRKFKENAPRNLEALGSAVKLGVDMTVKGWTTSEFLEPPNPIASRKEIRERFGPPTIQQILNAGDPSELMKAGEGSDKADRVLQGAERIHKALTMLPNKEIATQFLYNMGLGYLAYQVEAGTYDIEESE